MKETFVVSVYQKIMVAGGGMEYKAFLYFSRNKYDEFINANQMRKHMRSHSFTGRHCHYTEKNYKCEDCEFTSKTIETMEVHVGKCRTENFECGLCEYTADTLEKLETHLINCEVYECEECQYRTRFIKDIKSHIDKEYGAPKKLYHIKMNRNDKNLVDFKDYKSN